MLTFRVHDLTETKLETEWIQTIAKWYKQEWNIAHEKTIQQLSDTSDTKNVVFQILAFENGELIGTGGVYHEVGIHQHDPSYAQHKNWLALVYTLPTHRRKGKGLRILGEIESVAKSKNLEDLYLFTDTAINLYKRANYKTVETIKVRDRQLTIMKKCWMNQKG